MVTGSELHGHPAPNGQRDLTLRNRQRIRPLNLAMLRRIVRALLHEAWPEGHFDLAIYVVAAPEMTRINETFLQHQGSTDVITFDYAERVGQASRLSRSRAANTRARDRRDACPTLLHGQIFICVDEAVRQARRFRTTWQSELVRYAVHGVLHLLRYDDRTPKARVRMKAAEDGLVRRLARQFAFRSLSRPLRAEHRPHRTA